MIRHLVLGNFVAMILSVSMPAQVACLGANHYDSLSTTSTVVSPGMQIGVRLTAPAGGASVTGAAWFFHANHAGYPGETVSGSMAIRSSLGALPGPTVYGSAPFSAPYPTFFFGTWAGPAFAMPVAIPAGDFWIVLSLTGSTARAAEDAFGVSALTSGVTGSTHHFKVRIATIGCNQVPEYQPDSAAAHLAVDGVIGTPFSPATVMATVGVPVTLQVSSAIPVASWDIGVGLAPLVPRSGGGTPTYYGAVINLDVGDSSLLFLNAGFQGSPFAPFQLPVQFTQPGAVSVQMALFEPANALGVRLSQPVRVVVL